MSEPLSPAQLAARDQTDAHFADVTAQVQQKMAVHGEITTQEGIGPLEERIMLLWNEYLESDQIKICRHPPKDRLYWIIADRGLACEQCWALWRVTVGRFRCWSHTCGHCGRHQRESMEYRQHVVAFTADAGPGGQLAPVIIIPFVICANCEEPTL
jgi:hypothetical protein